MLKVKFDIKGMTCSSCSAHVEKAVYKLNGILKVNVNLLLNNMIVEYDESKVNNNKIIQAVIDAGYGASVSKENKRKDIDNKDTIKSMKKRLIISICFLIPLMYISMHHIGLKIPQILSGTQNALIYAFSQFLLLLPIIYFNKNYFITGFKRLAKRTPNMDSLIAIGSSASIIYGIYAIFAIGYGLGHNQLNLVEKYSKDIYFESAGMILTLITLGKYLETKSKGKTSEAINKLIELEPKTAVVIRDDKELEISIEQIIQGDIVVIKPGKSVPVDGIVIEGYSAIDQSSITGESIPVTKSLGDNVISGTINKNGMIKVKATKVGKDTTLSQIIKLVEEASNSKAPISRLADKVSGIFVPIVIVIAIVATIFWILNGQTFEFALSIGISVLVISCPCALGLATPVAIMVGTGKGAQNGILFKSGEALETLHLIDTVILDKTGTITEGKPKVTDCISFIEESEFLKIAGGLEKNSEHPLAEAVLEKANGLVLADVKDFESVLGRGIKGKIGGISCFAGNSTFMKENNISIDKKQVDKFLDNGKTVLYFARGNMLIGILAVADTIKQTSYTAIKELKKKNVEVAMVTGDNKQVAETIGRQLEIDKVVSEVLPADKEKEVSKMQSQNKKVAFVGDGINDSPALVKADVGIAIGQGTDIAIESADIVLMKNNLLDVVTAIELSKAVIRNIKINLFWAFFYNSIGIPIACGVFYLWLGLKLNPMIGALAMSLSSVCVVTNALRLRKFKTSYYSLEEKGEIKMDKKIIYIEGMQCNHCKMSVEKALSTISGITSVVVDLEGKNATINLESNVEDGQIRRVIEEAGFTVTNIVKE